MDPFTTVVPRTLPAAPGGPFYATLAQLSVYGQGEAVTAAKARMLPYLVGVARQHSDGDEALAEDLFQEGMLELVQLDPSRFRRDEDQVLRRLVAAAMQRKAYAEKKWRAQFEEADAEGDSGELPPATPLTTPLQTPPRPS